MLKVCQVFVNVIYVYGSFVKGQHTIPHSVTVTCIPVTAPRLIFFDFVVICKTPFNNSPCFCFLAQVVLRTMRVL